MTGRSIRKRRALRAWMSCTSREQSTIADICMSLRADVSTVMMPPSMVRDRTTYRARRMIWSAMRDAGRSWSEIARIWDCTHTAVMRACSDARDPPEYHI